jgi:NADPH-dependent ferric siderophore reductase
MTVTAPTVLPLILTEVEVRSVERLTPSYVRVELGSDALTDFGVDGPLYDQRIKLVFPGPNGRLPELAVTDASWYQSWTALPEDERGHVRTYTVRAVRGTGRDTRLVVDLVLHLAEGATGPGSRWAADAAVGDRLLLLAPRRGVPFGGIEFAPGDAGRLLLVGDETAVPAVASILGDLPEDAAGTAYLEVPCTADILDLIAPAGMRVVWLPRDGAAPGSRLCRAVLTLFGLDISACDPDASSDGSPGTDARADLEDEIDPDLWETPTYSSSGEPLPDSSGTTGGIYAWVAGESGTVTRLRRHLVRDAGLDRRQVAFMGYWRIGVAMRS